MANSKIGVIYDANSNAVLRVIVPDADASLIDGTHVPGPGEKMLIAQMAVDLSTATLQQQVILAVSQVSIG